MNSQVKGERWVRARSRGSAGVSVPTDLPCAPHCVRMSSPAYRLPAFCDFDTQLKLLPDGRKSPELH